MDEKLRAIDHLRPLMRDGATLFGATILGRGIAPNCAASALLDLYNAKGVFKNRADDLESLSDGLRRRFAHDAPWRKKAASPSFARPERQSCDGGGTAIFGKGQSRPWSSFTPQARGAISRPKHTLISRRLAFRQVIEIMSGVSQGLASRKARSISSGVSRLAPGARKRPGTLTRSERARATAKNSAGGGPE